MSAVRHARGASSRTLWAKSLSYVCFWLILQANPLFCFELWYSSCFNVKCWFHTFPKRCSHISMWILILLDHQVVMSILFQPACFSSIYPIRAPLRSLRIRLFHPSQVAFVFPPSHPFLQAVRFLNQVSFYSTKSLHCFPSMFLSSDTSWRCLGVSSSSFFILLFISGGFNSSFQCWPYCFPRLKCFLMTVHLLFIHLSLFISRVLKISQKSCVSILNPFKLLRGCYLIQAI
jgi:hypothetical protein